MEGSATQTEGKMEENEVEDVPKMDVKTRLVEGRNSEKWHEHKDLVERLEKFHTKHARFPGDKDGMNDVKEIQKFILEKLKDQFASLAPAPWKIRDFEYTGSIYEKLKIGKPDEFDIMVTMVPEGVTVKPSSREGFKYLVPKNPENSQYRTVINNGYISSSKMQSAFFSILAKAVKALGYSRKFKLRMHGPAVQIDINAKDLGESFAADAVEEFSIDVVPVFNISGGLYVAKCFKGDRDAWRYSTSLEEKKLLKTMDSDNGLRKQCLRILKAIREKEPGFRTLDSFHLKNAVFLIAKTKQEEKDWQRQEHGKRIMDVLKYLQDCLEQKRMEHHFCPDVNLFEDIKPIACKNLAFRLRRLRLNRNAFFRLIATHSAD